MLFLSKEGIKKAKNQKRYDFIIVVIVLIFAIYTFRKHFDIEVIPSTCYRWTGLRTVQKRERDAARLREIATGSKITQETSCMQFC